MSKQHTDAPTGLWNRTARALGKFLAGVVSLPDARRHSRAWSDYPTFPPF
jgi:hypothetical protein